jgi:hypothetical protein
MGRVRQKSRLDHISRIAESRFAYLPTLASATDWVQIRTPCDTQRIAGLYLQLSLVGIIPQTITKMFITKEINYWEELWWYASLCTLPLFLNLQLSHSKVMDIIARCKEIINFFTRLLSNSVKYTRFYPDLDWPYSILSNFNRPYQYLRTLPDLKILAPRHSGIVFSAHKRNQNS